MDTDKVTSKSANALDIAFMRDAENLAVCVVDGFGAAITTSSGRLVVKDGIGRHRRTRTFTRATHGLARVVVLARSGIVTLDAVQWMDGAGVAWCALAPDGDVLATSTHAATGSAHLLRAQALAMGTETGLTIARRLIEMKLAGQASIARHELDLPILGSDIESLRSRLADSATLEELRQLEAAAANLYWAGWGTVEPTFVEQDRPRVPEHWLRFDGRRSAVFPAKNAHASNVTNCLVNYATKLLEIEATIALRAVGLSPHLGILHADVAGDRPSMALDVVEAVRPEAEGHVLRILRTPQMRRNFHEDRRGVVRVLAPLSHRLAEATPSYGRALAPTVEWVAQTLGKASPYDVTTPSVLTRSKHKQVARVAHTPSPGETPLTVTASEVGIHLRTTQRQKPKAPKSQPDLPMPACKVCGVVLEREASRPRRRGAYCPRCLAERRRELGAQVRELGTATSAPHPETPARQSVANSSQRLAEQRWELEHEGEVPDREWYLREVLPGLAGVTTTVIAKATGMSTSSASKIRAGKRVPHPRWWGALVDLVRA
jgi:CRISPR-associated endonuclease Cas1